MTATLTTVAGILKEVYEGTVVDQLQENAIAMKRIASSSDGVFEDAGGKFVRFPIRLKRNQGISYRAEGAQLGAPGRQGYVQTSETLKYGYGRVRFTGQVMGLADSNPKAFVDAADQEIEGLKSDVTRDSNRIAWGHPDGFATTAGTGVISKITSGTTSTTINAPHLNQIEVDMVIDVVNGSGVVQLAGLTVVSITSDSAFVVDSSVTTTTGHYIVRSGNWNQEPLGLSALYTSSGTIHGINSATAGQEKWKAALDDSTTTTLTETVMITACDRIKTAGGDMPTAIFCSLGVRRAYYDIFLGLRRYNEPKQWPGGLVGLTFSYDQELPVVADIDCPANSMYIVNEKQMTIYSNQDWHFDDTDGNMFKWVSGYDMYEAYFKRYWQLVTHKRNSGARFTALTEH